MPKKHNNLEGWCRDVADIQRTGGEAYGRFLDLLGTLIDDCEDGVDETDGGCPAAGDTPAVDSRQPPLRETSDVGPSRPTAGSSDVGSPASVLDRALDGLAGPERVEAQRELDQLRMHSLGAPSGRKLIARVSRHGT